MSGLTSILQTQFGFSSFRPHQEEVCQHATEGRDTLLVMPTGAGKSLCYQLPGLARGGVTLVISPLLALIENQVAKLCQAGISADRIHSGRTREQLRQACISYLSGNLKFLFVAPERLSLTGFVEMLKKRPPSLIAVDEAHCISHWGHDFRPDYRLLGSRIKDFRPTPVIALTATATPLVQNDVCKQLGLINEVRSIHGFRRENIAIQVVEAPQGQRTQMIRSILSDKTRLPAIVYAPTRKTAEQIQQDLGAETKAAIYHAGMTSENRDKNQDLFLSGTVDVIVATVAFGMGIDKPNIRTVIHAALPGSVEGYYQEIGRAGRDGLPSQAILLSSFSDQRTHDFFFERDYPETSQLRRVFEQLKSESIPKLILRQTLSSMKEDVFEKSLEKLWTHQGVILDYEENAALGQASWEKTYIEQREHKARQLLQMIEFAQGTQCRMLSLVRYFGDQKDSGARCGTCDVCAPLQHSELSPSRLLTQTEQKLVAHIIAILTGERYRAVGRIFQELTETQPDLPRQDVERLLRAVAIAGWVDITQDQFEKVGRSISYRKVSLTAMGLKIKAQDLAELKMLDAPPSEKPKRKKERAKKEGPSAEAARTPLFEAFRSWRLAEAKKRGVPAFCVLSDRVILALCESRPNSEASLLSVKGLGPKLNQLYGADILKLIQEVRT